MNDGRTLLRYPVILSCLFTFFQAQVVYYQRHQDYERCREALRIAEQGAEIGATGENKVEKRKRLEEEV